jgi:hypothetical protein
MIAGLAAIWLTTVIRKVMTGSVPSLLAISVLVLTVQTAVALATGELWLFLLQFPLANLAMSVMFARTAGGPDPIVARLAAEGVALRQPARHHLGLHRFFQGQPGCGPTGASAPWFLAVLRKAGLRLRFAPA